MKFVLRIADVKRGSTWCGWIVFSLLFFMFGAKRAFSELRISGSSKVYMMSSQRAPVEGEPQEAFQNLLSPFGRVNVFYPLSSIQSWDFSYALYALYGEMSSLSLENKSSPYRMVDFPNQITSLKGEPVTVYQNLDRLKWNYATDRVDLRVGRQAISFGSARAINPTDVFAPFSLTVLDQEERFGVDGVRVRLPMGDVGEIDVGFVSGKEGSESSHVEFLRSQWAVNGWDLSPMLMALNSQWMASLDVQGSLGGAGVWMEAAYLEQVRASVGIDSQLSEDLYGFIEYHHNGFGRAKPDEYQFIQKVFLLGRDYLIPGFSIALSPLWSLSLQIFANLHDHSQLMTSQVSYNIEQNMYLDFSLMISQGLSATLSGFRSEFGLYSNYATFVARYYF